jgi:hypothetical protein
MFVNFIQMYVEHTYVLTLWMLLAMQ